MRPRRLTAKLDSLDIQTQLTLGLFFFPLVYGLCEQVLANGSRAAWPACYWAQAIPGLNDAEQMAERRFPRTMNATVPQSLQPPAGE